MTDDIDARELIRIILHLEGAKYEHYQQCKECRAYGFAQGCEQGKALQAEREKWAVLNVAIKKASTNASL
jgi:hypothetical protein